jgi:hypothetical protein
MLFNVDISWNRTLSSTEMSWKKSYSPPPLGNHSYPEQIHSNRNTTWDPLSKSSSRTDDNKRDRERRIGGDGRRSRDSNRRVADPVVKPPTPATRTEELRSPIASEPPTAIVAPKVEEIEETRPSSSAVEVEAEENFSDFSDDVDEILNRDLQVVSLKYFSLVNRFNICMVE